MLKARQLGCSTFTEGFLISEVIQKPNTKIGIITHRDDATANLFNMSKYFYNNLREEIKPTILTDNINEMVFNTKDNKGLNSRIKVMTASDSGVGRSDTYNCIHCSEYAFWKCPQGADIVLQGLLSSVPDNEHSIVIIESTANGFNHFYDLWNKAVKTQEGTASDNERTEFVPLFFAWFMGDDYTRQYPEDEFRVNPLTPYEQMLMKKYPNDMTLEKIYWRRHKIRTTFFGNVEMFKQEFPSTPDEAFRSTGACAFDLNKLNNRINEVYGVAPKKQGKFIYDIDKYTGKPINIKFNEEKKFNDDYLVKIFVEPNKKTPYLIGGDTAGQGSDNYVGQVINNVTIEQVATLCMAQGEDEFARQLYCLGLYYNTAMITVENNVSPLTNHYLDKWEYPCLHIYQTQNNFTGGYTTSYGFRTTSGNKVALIKHLDSHIKDNVGLINDYATLCEMTKYQVTNENGTTKYGALRGFHDDYVMALAIALLSREDMQHPVEYYAFEIDNEIKDYIPFALREEVEQDYGGYIELWN